MALEERTANLSYIRKLKRIGGDANSFFARFMTIEKEFVGSGKLDGFVRELNSLNNDLVIAISKSQKEVQADPGLRQGAFYERRRALYSRLEELSRSGKDVNEMKRIFRESIEAKVGSPSSEYDIGQALTMLENRLRYIH